jgi:hypothetical protein
MSDMPTLRPEDFDRIKAMDRDDLLRHAASSDLAVLVEASLRLRETTDRLNKVLIGLTIVLVFLTAAILAFTIHGAR